MSKTSDSPQTAGLLTQPLISSPAINWILPARLRNTKHNDVVFIGERRIQIKEALPSGHLEDVVENTEFEGSPLGAKVINVNNHLPWEVKLSENEDHVRDVDDIPPQLLFMATDSHELLFMYYSQLNHGRFVSHRRPLPRDVNLSEKYGRHIAVDPHSRAVAVSASRNFLAIFWLKSSLEIQSQMAKGKLDPIEGERYLQVDGDILFMEFLYPKNMGINQILLLLIVHKNEATQAMIFEWEEYILRDSRREPHLIITHLPSQDYLPSLIIPLAKESSYLLVTTRSMAMYTPTSSCRPMRYPPIIPDEGAHQIGIWTRWARPARNWLYSQKYDGIFLSREDGWIYYLEFGNDGELETQTSLGKIPCNVDTAFDVLHMGYEGGDFILAAGSQGDGGLFVQEARSHPICVQRLINWAPVTDAVVVPFKSQNNDNGNLSRDRLFVCSTSAFDKGAINELRYGIEARVGSSIPLGRHHPPRDMWAMTPASAHSIYLMISDPVSSLLLHTVPGMADGIDSLEDEDGWDQEAETLAIGCTPSGAMVQVTKHNIHLFVPGEPALTYAIEQDIGSSAIAAAVDGPNLVLAVVTSKDKKQILQVIRMTDDSKRVSLAYASPHPLDQEPVCMFLQNWGNLQLIFLGNPDGTVISFEAYDSSPGEEIKQHAETNQLEFDFGHNLSNAISSITAIRTFHDGGATSLLLCGTRSGVLVPFEMKITAVDGYKGLEQKPAKHLGQTSIKLQAQGEIALFTCGDDFWRVAFSPHIKSPGYVLSRVLVTDQSHPAWFPSSISGFALVNLHGANSGASDVYLFCYVEGDLLICSLDTEENSVSRRIDLPGNPNKMVYSEHLQSLIVSYSIVETIEQRPLDVFRKSCLEFVDPNSKEPVSDYDEQLALQGLTPWRPSGSPGEKITCIFDWMPEKDGNAYHLIAIGTSIPTPHDPKERKGRIVLLQASKNPKDPHTINCSEKHMRLCDRPVHAMAAFSDSLIVASGKSFLPIASRNSQVRWVPTITATLPSPAVTMTVHDKIITVTTARHSMLTYKILEGDIFPVESDTIARDGLSHTFVNGLDVGSNLTFVSTRGGTVRVFADTDVLDTFEPRQTATLPVSILRLVQGCKSPTSLLTTKSVYGFAINGSVYRFTSLYDSEWKILSALSFMCMRDASIYPSLAHRGRFLNGASHFSADRHIDGSVLTRLLARGPTYLEDMIDKCGKGQIRWLSPLVKDCLELGAAELFGPPVRNYAPDVFVWLGDLLRVDV